MDVQALSERILESNFGQEILHEETFLENDFDQNGSSELMHYGVLGMKWGVRKERKPKVKKKDVRYENESDQEYQARMERESRERQQQANLKAQAAQNKRELKERSASQKRQLKSQEKNLRIQQESQLKREESMRKSQERQREREAKRLDKAQRKEEQLRRERENKKTKASGQKVTTLTDQELNDAINRYQKEKQYKELSAGKVKKTAMVVGAATGAVLLAAGKAVAERQLKDVGNEKAADFLQKKGWLKTPDDKTKDRYGQRIDDLEKLVKEISKQLS